MTLRYDRKTIKKISNESKLKIRVKRKLLEMFRQPETKVEVSSFGKEENLWHVFHSVCVLTCFNLLVEITAST